MRIGYNYLLNEQIIISVLIFLYSFFISSQVLLYEPIKSINNLNRFYFYSFFLQKFLRDGIWI